jgi:hypothetical protein
MVMAALLAAGTTVARADHTNLVENVRINFTALKQGRTVTSRTQVTMNVNTVRVNTREVIDALGSSLGTSFSTAARLVLVTPQDGSSPSAMQVRDGANQVDVSSYFVLEQKGGSVTSSTLTIRTGRSNQTVYSVEHVALQDGANPISLHFDVSGVGADFSANHPVPGPDNSLTIDASGSGDNNGATLILQGTVAISGQTTEVVSDGNNMGSN